MSPDVALEQPWSREALPAKVALAALVVGPQVHRVGRHRDVGLVAVRALASFFVLKGSKNIKNMEPLRPKISLIWAQQ